MNVLLVANFAPDAGYAWNTIESVFHGVSKRLRADGARVLISYPSIERGPPPDLARLGVEFVEADYHRVRRKSFRHVVRFLRLLRRHRVQILYLTDRPTWSPLYPLFHAAGVETIILHKRVATEAYDPSAEPRKRIRDPGAATRLKHLIHRIPTLAGDRYIAVSDFVKLDLLEVHGTPAEYTFRIYNGIELERFAHPPSDRLRDVLPAVAGRPVVFMASRAHRVKGVHILVEAARVLKDEGRGDLSFVFCGDGPALPELERLAAERGLERSFHFLGLRDDVARLLPCATVAVVPSLWKEAFGLSVVEAMASGVPVVASRTGGIPELVVHERTGLLTPPGDVGALARAIRRVVDDEEFARRLGEQGRVEARRRFSIDRTIEGIYEVFRPLIVEPGSTPSSPAIGEDPLSSPTSEGHSAPPTVSEYSS